ncbi:MAG: long-chain fatty acid--CoA ligase [Clostridiaceae bacterium]|nr:long-chain fatty acid--CoA ligase [Clostridiaceae bacterium]
MDTPVYETRFIKNLKDMLKQSAELFVEKNAFYVKQGDEYTGIKYKDFKFDVDALGSSLLELGLSGKNIAVIGENRYEWCLTYLSTVNGLGVIVPLDKELPIKEIENLLSRSNATAIIYSGKFHDSLKVMSQNLENVKYFINMDINENDDEKFLSFSALLENGKKLISSGNLEYINLEVDENIMNMLIFTSGTTDHAKGVMLSHKNICSDIMAVCASIYIDSKDSVLSILPLHHTYACTADFLTMIYSGVCISFNEGLKHIAKNLKETHPTILILVPLILESMYKKIWDQASKKLSLKIKLKVGLVLSNFLYNNFKVDIRKKLFKQILDNIGGNIRLVVSGAAGIDPQVSKGFRSMGIPILQGYGLTEASPIVTVNKVNFYRDDSIGLVIPGVEVKIHNPDSNGLGEIIVKGDNVMLGYFDNVEATSKVLKDGWLYTGDIGRMDENGFVYITGRQKNVIVTKNGKNIFPEEVEAYLNKSTYILESLVSGKDDEKSGETIVTAQIVPDIDAIKVKLKAEEVSPEEIYKLIKAEGKSVNKNMPLYKRILEFTVRENEFAKTTTKKIKRYVEKG